jgi:hypothetical protein
MTTPDDMRNELSALEARDQVPLRHSTARRTSVQNAIQRYLAGELAMTRRKRPKGRADREQDARG